MTPKLVEEKLLHLTNRQEWRAWLQEHYRSEKEAWLVNYKKHTGKERIPYNDAVEEGRSVLAGSTAPPNASTMSATLKGSPRGKPKSPYSQPNKERMRLLIKQGKVMDEVLAGLGDFADEPFEIPADILMAIQANEVAWQNFQNFSEGYVRIRIAFIEGARKRPEEFEKRLRFFIEKTEKNKQFGFGGIEKYY